MTPKDIFEALGHDGSEIIEPDLEDPFCRRGFHIQELVAFAVSRYYHPVEIQATPVTEYPSSISTYDNTVFLTEVLSKTIGVLIGEYQGKRHAVAWDGHQVLDPTGYKYPINDFEIETFYAFF